MEHTEHPGLAFLNGLVLGGPNDVAAEEELDRFEAGGTTRSGSQTPTPTEDGLGVSGSSLDVEGAVAEPGLFAVGNIFKQLQKHK